MHQYRQIIYRLRLGESIRSIAKTGLAGRNKIRSIYKIAKQQGWLDTCTELPTEKHFVHFFGRLSPTTATQSSVLPYKKQVIEWYQQGVQATTIHAALQRQFGFNGSYDAVQRFARNLKDLSIEATTILDFKPGECAQVDFGLGPKLIDEGTGEVLSTWIFVMVLAWSRHMYAEIVLRQDVETWLGCHRHAFEWFGGVPQKITIDNPKCAITRACYYDPVVQRSYAEYAEGYGFIVEACPPRQPKKKGRVESGVEYVKKNFLPLRQFRNQVDANRQLTSWILETAGNRIHGSTHEKPLTLFAGTESLFLKRLPDKPPECAVWAKVTVHGDCHVQFLKCRYSVPYQLLRQVLWLRASETMTIHIYHDHNLVAIHPCLFKHGSRRTLQEHLPPNALAYKMRDSQWCLNQATKVGPYCKKVIQQLLTDSVVHYLRAAQGIVSLEKTYGKKRLDAACRRALIFHSVHYKTIKSILYQGVEYAPIPDQEAFDTLAQTYTGQGRFCRDTSTLLQ